MICCLVAESSTAGTPAVLEAVARACSPRVATYGADAVLFDAGGLGGLFGTPEALALDVQRLAAERDVAVRVAVAVTSTAAWILAHARPGVTVAVHRETDALATLPLAALAMLPEMALAPDAPLRRRRSARARHFRMAPGPDADRSSNVEVRTSKLAIAIIERWGLHTLGELARVPRADLHARLGPIGVRLHQAACGEDATPFVPVEETIRWVERVECEWPIEGLEPLSFVLARICEPLSARLEHADRGAVEVTTRLWLVTRDVHVRTLHLPAPMRDARGLRTLVLLDLESHPPGAGIDVVEVELDVAPGRIVHGSLLARPVPESDQIATLTARLGALMGETRIGAPVLVDTHDERQCAMKRFSPTEPRNPRTSEPRNPGTPEPAGVGALRRFRLPIAARVVVEHHTPVRVMPSARGIPGGAVVACAGPWRSSGYWWALDRSAWDRDEWDVELADGGVYRVARDRTAGGWVIEGAID